MRAEDRERLRRIARHIEIAVEKGQIPEVARLDAELLRLLADQPPSEVTEEEVEAAARAMAEANDDHAHLYTDAARVALQAARRVSQPSNCGTLPTLPSPEAMEAQRHQPEVKERWERIQRRMRASGQPSDPFPVEVTGADHPHRGRRGICHPQDRIDMVRVVFDRPDEAGVEAAYAAASEVIEINLDDW